MDHCDIFSTHETRFSTARGSFLYDEKWPLGRFSTANHSNTNRVVTILIHSDKTLFQIIFVMLLRRVSKDVTSSLLLLHKRYDFNATNFRRHRQ